MADDGAEIRMPDGSDRADNNQVEQLAARGEQHASTDAWQSPFQSCQNARKSKATRKQRRPCSVAELEDDSFLVKIERLRQKLVAKKQNSGSRGRPAHFPKLSQPLRLPTSMKMMRFRRHRPLARIKDVGRRNPSVPATLSMTSSMSQAKMGKNRKHLESISRVDGLKHRVVSVESVQRMRRMSSMTTQALRKISLHETPSGRRMLTHGVTRAVAAARSLHC
eukprot:TRINITY_DN36675_c0_g1_i1.p1 TRINITY_DN36675_c0_g1~~TRINITY_DN36675_c0_g1_i1.p1  ORF type:complete len:254 (+),score=18.14 TRINITY_DN36675_c0_g1_i1:97-762(+)